MTLRRGLLLLVLAVLLPTAGLFAWIVVAAYQRQLDAEAQHLRETVRALAQVVDREFDKRAAIARTLAITSGLAEGDHRRFYDEARAATEGTGNWVVLADDQNELVDTSVPFGTALPHPSWRMPPARPDGAPQVSDLHIGPISHRPVLQVIAPVPNIVPAHFSVAVAFTPEALQGIFTEQRLPAGWMGSILDRAHRVVAQAPDPEPWLGKPVNGELARWLETAGPEGFVDTAALDGAPVRSFYSLSPVYHWAVVISVPQQALSAPARRAAWAAGVSAALLAAFALALAAWSAQRIRRPIEALERAAHELAQDRVPVIVPTGLDEADAVGAALYRAGVQAAQINEELERRVAAALEAARSAQARSEELQRVLAEELLHLITDNLPVLISYVDREGCYRLNNQAYETWFGLPRSQITGRPVREVIGETAWSRVGPHLDAALAGHTAQFETTLPYPGIGPRRVEVVYVPHRGAGGSVQGVAILVQDQTARYRAHEELRRLNHELAEAHRRKDEFLATLAHELRNPLAPITTALEILRRRETADPTARAARDVIERQVRQMTRLVEELLDVARITSGRIGLKRRRVALADVAHEAVEAARPIVDAGGHALEVQLPEVPLWLDADPARLTQVLLNLLNNAAKYTPHGGRITLSARPDGDMAEISVRDNGIGLAPAHLGTVFEMFSQVSPALERAEGGLGIGLALARGLVALHGGSIEARSEGLGRGSEFVVRLPLAPAPAAEPPASAPMATQPGSALRVMVVDDNRDAAESLATLLSMMGHETALAHDGASALALGESFRPALALLDIGMPGMNGYELARRIRGLPWGRGVVLAALTGWGQQDDRRRAFEAGFDHHLTKPVEASALEAVLAAAAATPPGPSTEA